MGPQPEIYEPQPTPVDEIDTTKENKEAEGEEKAEEVKDEEEEEVVTQDKSVRKRKVKMI